MLLIVVMPVYIAAIVDQVTDPCTLSNDPLSRPPGTVASNEVECSICGIGVVNPSQVELLLTLNIRESFARIGNGETTSSIPTAS